MSNSRYIVYSLKAGRDFYSFRLKSATYCSVVVTFFIMTVLFSCKKVEYVSIGKINGPAEVCYASLSEIYFIDSVPDVKIIWTVPEDAEIISGQTTSKIKVKFGRKEGKILANYYRKGEVISDSAAFLNITFGVPGKWCQIPDFGGGVRQSVAAFTIGSKAYIVSGYNGVYSLNDVWEFDSNDNSWKEKESFIGLARYQGIAFSIGNKGYFGTGYIGSVLSDFWEYDPATDSWEQKANCGTVDRQYAFGFSLNNKGYIGGGEGSLNNSLNDFYEYNPLSNEWVQKADIAQPCHGSVSFVIGNRAYMGTGRNNAGYRTEFWEYDPTDSSNGLDVNNNPLGKWIPKATFPGVGRYLAVAFSINNKGYIGTGFTETANRKDFWEYDPEQNNWVEKDSLNIKRGFAIGFSIQNKGYIGTGMGNNLLKDFYVYTQ